MNYQPRQLILAAALAVLMLAGEAKALDARGLENAFVEAVESVAPAVVHIRVETLELPWDMSKSFDDEKAVAETREAISRVLERIAETAEKRFYDVLILDEIVFCLSKGLARLEDIKSIIDRKAGGVEIVMTGRGAAKELLDLADLVTEMKNVKHPFDKGIGARRGIEY